MRRPTSDRLAQLLTLVLVVALALFALVGIAGCGCEDDPDTTAEQSTDDEAGSDDTDSEDGSADADDSAEGDASDDDEDADGDDDEEFEEGLSSFFVYFSYGGDRALAVTREVEYPMPDWESAMVELLAGPLDQELATWPVLGTNIPDGTELLSIAVDDGVATVDLSEEFESGGGTFSVTARLAEVVYTLCQFDSIDSVLFEIEGEVVEMFSGEGLMLDGEPQTPEDYYDLIPVDA